MQTGALPRPPPAPSAQVLTAPDSRRIARAPSSRPVVAGPLPVALRFEGNRVLPNEVYSTVLSLANLAAATSTRTSSTDAAVDLVQTARNVEALLTQFLRRSGYLLATVRTEISGPMALTVDIDEGRLDRVLVLGQGLVRTLQLQLNLNLPQKVFNRFALERQLAELVKERGLIEARYEVVPMKHVVHQGIQLPRTDVLENTLRLISPGAPHELRIFVQQPEWRTGFGQGIGFQSPDGFFVSANYQAASAFIDDDRWFSELQVAVRSFEAIFSQNDNVGVSRIAAVNKWFGPPLGSTSLRPTLDIDLRLVSRFRGDLGIDSYQFAPLSGWVAFSFEPYAGITLLAGGGVQFRTLFSVEPKADVVLRVDTAERTLRGFAKFEAAWNFEPERLRQDRQDTLRLEATYFTGGGDAFDAFTRTTATYDLMFSVGYDELRFEVDGALLFGDVPFYDEVAMGDGFVRVGYTGDFFTRAAGSISAEYRLSLSRDVFKISLFNDAAIFDQLNDDRTSDQLQFMNSVGLGLHILVLNTFQISVYGGAGFVPKLSPLPGVSIQVKQAY